MNRRFPLIFATLFAGVASLFIPGDAHAIGISPATIQANNIKPGQNVTLDVYIVRPPGEDSPKIRITQSGTLTQFFSYPSEVQFASGEYNKLIPLTLEVSENAAVGCYDAEITVTPDSPILTAIGSAVGVTQSVTACVTDKDVYDVTIRSLGLIHDGLPGSPVKIQFTATNHGNVAAHITDILISMTDELTHADPIDVRINVESENGYIPPFSKKEFYLDIEQAIPPGIYRASVQINDGTKKITYKPDIIRSIGPLPTLQRPSKGLFGNLRFTVDILIMSALIGITLIILIYFIIKRHQHT